MNQLDLMLLQTEVLYRLDERGRLLCVNEPGDPPAPLFFMGRTAVGNTWRLRHDLPDDLARELELLCRAEPATADLEPPPRCYDAVRALLAAFAPIDVEYRGPAYRFPDAYLDLPGATLIDAANAGLLLPNFASLIPRLRERSPVAAVAEHGAAVSVCYCARLTPRAAEAGLETVEGCRGRGYGPAAAALWATAVRRSGRRPLYSTSWENGASRAVARKLGLIQYGEDWSIGGE